MSIKKTLQSIIGKKNVSETTPEPATTTIIDGIEVDNTALDLIKRWSPYATDSYEKIIPVLFEFFKNIGLSDKKLVSISEYTLGFAGVKINFSFASRLVSANHYPHICIMEPELKVDYSLILTGEERKPEFFLESVTRKIDDNEMIIRYPTSDNDIRSTIEVTSYDADNNDEEHKWQIISYIKQDISKYSSIRLLALEKELMALGDIKNITPREFYKVISKYYNGKEITMALYHGTNILWSIVALDKKILNYKEYSYTDTLDEYVDISFINGELADFRYTRNPDDELFKSDGYFRFETSAEDYISTLKEYEDKVKKFAEKAKKML